MGSDCERVRRRERQGQGQTRCPASLVNMVSWALRLFSSARRYLPSTEDHSAIIMLGGVCGCGKALPCPASPACLSARFKATSVIRACLQDLVLDKVKKAGANS